VAASGRRAPTRPAMTGPSSAVGHTTAACRDAEPPNDRDDLPHQQVIASKYLTLRLIGGRPRSLAATSAHRNERMSATDLCAERCAPRQHTCRSLGPRSWGVGLLGAEKAAVGGRCGLGAGHRDGDGNIGRLAADGTQPAASATSRRRLPTRIGEPEDGKAGPGRWVRAPDHRPQSVSRAWVLRLPLALRSWAGAQPGPGGQGPAAGSGPSVADRADAVMRLRDDPRWCYSKFPS
jgi:hypothetical protein